MPVALLFQPQLVVGICQQVPNSLDANVQNHTIFIQNPSFFHIEALLAGPFCQIFA